MSFNIAVAGLNAAHKRMEVAGNNIANAGTAGFKSARAEFSAVYGSSMLGGGKSTVGHGVQLANVSQNFAPGSAITDTGRALDMRIQGNGFFVMSDNGAISYGRAGAFLSNAENFVVDSHGSRLQGYGVDPEGRVISGAPTDLRIDSASMSPKATSKIEQTMNLDSAAASLAAMRSFDVKDPTTWTRMTTQTIQDGATPPQSHQLDHYLVKTDDNRWTSYIFIDNVNPLDPGSAAPLETSLYADANGMFHLVGGTGALMVEKGTELVLQNWQPAMQANGSSKPSGAPNGGVIKLAMNDAKGPVLDSGDALAPRVVPAFDPNDLSTYNKAFTRGIFDSLGNQHQLTQYFVKDGGNSWKMHMLINGRHPQDPQSTDPMTASMLFDARGSLQSLTGGQGLAVSQSKLTLEGWVPAKAVKGSATPMRWTSNGAVGNGDGIAIDLSKLSQHNGATSSAGAVIDGHAAGQANQLTIDKQGMISVGFTNSMHRKIGQVMLASFANLQGLQPVTNTRWVETFESGVANYDSPGEGTLGTIVSHSLEGSNVELSEQLVELIQAQTAYQANSKSLSTEAELMQTLIRAT